MWNRRSFLMRVRVKVKGARPRVHFSVLAAIYVLHELLLSFDALLCLLPGKWGAYTRGSVDSAATVLCGIMNMAPQNIVHVDVEHHKQSIQVDIGSVGIGGEE